MRKTLMFLLVLCIAAPYAYAAEKNYTDSVTGMEFVLVKGGCFKMGDTYGDRRPEEDKDEVPVHEVCVDDVYMGKYEVTVAEFRKFVNDTGYRTDAEKDAGGYSGCMTIDFDDNKWDWRGWANWKNPNKYQSNRNDHPVSCISWNDAKAFTKWLSSKTGKGYRLPTEAEWEYAARAGTQTRNYWGNSKDDACRYANVRDLTSFEGGRTWKEAHDCKDGYAFVAPVGQFRPNDFGLYDMMGNVWEWCEDWFNKDYYSNSPKWNPTGPTSGEKRIARGGSWIARPLYLRASHRGDDEPVLRDANDGFRVVLPSR
ncbi:MAG: formylglycine-generating enzyme family protein [Nitrospirae bacterium]|nr:MAG: formylglycine-generating enzyme family protein [Nitrospirota bacterium]